MTGVTDEIERHRAIRIAYRDIDGTARIEEAGGLRAVCHLPQCETGSRIDAGTHCPQIS